MNTIKLNTIGEVFAKGGGDSGSGGGNKSNYKYYDCSNDSQLGISHQVYLADYIKTFNTNTGNFEIAPEADGRLIAVAFDMSKRMYVNGEWIDAKTFFEEREGFDFSAHKEITEEEFYNVELEEGDFTIVGRPYQADEGMTWQEFVESTYNDGSININTSNGYVNQNNQYLASPESGYVREADTIVMGFNYQYLDI